MNKKKKTIVLIALSLVTLILAGVAVMTAWKLRQISYEEDKPTVPERPKAQEIAEPTLPPAGSCYLAFGGPTGTPTPTPTGTLTPSPTPTETLTPTPSPTGTLTPSPTPTETLTPTPSPTGTLTPSPTPLPGTTPTPIPTITEQALPEAGIISPTLWIGFAGLALLALGLLL